MFPVPFIKIILPVVTRWNSVTMCMKTVVRIAPALKKVAERELDMFRGKLPSNKQLDSYGEMLAPLLRIKSLSEELEADKKPTIHLALVNLGRLGTMKLSPKFKSSSRTTQALYGAFDINLKSPRRFPDLGRSISLYAMANFLHPTYKGSVLNYDGDDVSYDRTLQLIKDLFPEVPAVTQDSQSQDSQEQVRQK